MKVRIVALETKNPNAKLSCKLAVCLRLCLADMIHVIYFTYELTVKYHAEMNPHYFLTRKWSFLYVITQNNLEYTKSIAARDEDHYWTRYGLHICLFKVILGH